MIPFEIIGEIRDIETIATGRGVQIRRHLERIHGIGRKDFKIKRIIR